MTEIELNKTLYRCHLNGDIERYYEKDFRHFKKGWNKFKLNHDNNGYLRFMDKDRIHYSVHRLIAIAFLGLNNEDKTIFVDHINRNKTDNRLENLRLLSNQKNQFNSNAKGYYLIKSSGKFQSQIYINGKHICLGTFETKEEAQQAYLEAKQIYHKI